MAMQQQIVNEPFRESRWIRCPGTAEKINFYAVFRTVFFCNDPEKERPLLRLAVSGNQATTVNGKLADSGQYTDFPAHKKFNERDLSPFCRTGENFLEIAVYFSGNAFTSHYDGSPGLIAEIISASGTLLAASSGAWKCAEDLRYASGDMPKLSSSLNYTFDFDAAKENGKEVPAEEFENTATLSLRNVPQMECGTFFCGREIRRGKDHIVYDLGKEVAGLLTLEVTAPEDARHLLLVHGEYLTGSRVRQTFFARNFADHYRCRAGKQKYVHYFRRIAARYLEIVFPDGAADDVTIHAFGIHETPPDLPETPEFFCNDGFFPEAYAVSIETLKLCMHEKYENCPWREQSICEYDARNQMLFGYPVWGNPVRAKAMLELYAQSVRPSGFPPAAVPSATDLVIPAYAFPFLTAICEYELYCGDDTGTAEFLPLMQEMLKKILALKKDDLYMPPSAEEEKHLWNYCEAPALENMPDPPNAFYQLYLHETLSESEKLFRRHGDAAFADLCRSTAEALGRIAVARYFDSTQDLFADHINANGEKECFHGHIQMLFLERGLVTNETLRQKIFDDFRNGSLETPALGALPYLIRAMFQYGNAEERAYMHEKLKHHYGIMLAAGAQTWWEVISGKDYGAGAGSLCHGWSAAPLYYIHEFLLGITPLDAGYRTFRFKPYAGAGVEKINGKVWTPHGFISVSWEKKADGLHAQLTVPENCTAVVESYPETPIAKTEIKTS